VSPLLFAALVAILSVQPNLRISRISEPVRTVISQSAGATTFYELHGWTTCTTKDGKGHVDIIVTSDHEDTDEHEALHGADCIDDGKMNGSLLPYKPRTDDPGHEWTSWAMVNPEQAIKIMEGMR